MTGLELLLTAVCLNMTVCEPGLEQSTTEAMPAELEVNYLNADSGEQKGVCTRCNASFVS